MADDNLDQRLTRIETALAAISAAMATKADLAGLATKDDLDAVRADIAALQTKTDGIEADLTKAEERHAELLSAIRDLRDQFFVQGNILMRLEHRDHNADAV